MQKNAYLVICGPLASGKTSLTRLIAEKLNYQPIYENLKEHLYFTDYYSDMYKWGFHTAIYFLVRALESQRAVRKVLNVGPVCQDWFVNEHQAVYNKHMFRQGILTERDYVACEHLDKILSDYSVRPDLVIYLKTQASTLLDRISKRRRQEIVQVFFCN